jgi:hypothetical protein
VLFCIFDAKLLRKFEMAKRISKFNAVQPVNKDKRPQDENGRRDGKCRTLSLHFSENAAVFTSKRRRFRWHGARLFSVLAYMEGA